MAYDPAQIADQHHEKGIGGFSNYFAGHLSGKSGD